MSFIIFIVIFIIIGIAFIVITFAICIIDILIISFANYSSVYRDNDYSISFSLPLFFSLFMYRDNNYSIFSLFLFLSLLSCIEIIIILSSSIPHYRILIIFFYLAVFHVRICNLPLNSYSAICLIFSASSPTLI